MDVCKSLFSSGFMLTQEIARQIFEVLPDSGPLIVIMDTTGRILSSNPEEFAKLNISESFFEEICVSIDDGAEPVVTNSNNCIIIAEQLASEESNCGYVFVILPGYDPESVLSSIDLIETLLNQIGLIARFIEKINLHYEAQMKDYHVFGKNEAVLN
ncbi:MAG: hypothetical protein JW837_19255 [Sedimentisphaerales bacterium]|nr:hypothetical protein [Sedimentisphaerales bacterium]